MKKNFDIDYQNIKFHDMLNHKPIYFKNDNKYDNCDIVFVTAFLNINRDNWNNYKRTNKSYIDAFMFYLIKNINIIVFIDESIYDEYKIILNNYIHNIRCQGNFKTKIIPINIDWLQNHSLCWKKNDLQRDIMNTFYYKSLVLERIKKGCPENIYPEYNTVNHCKIDYIKYVIDNKYVGENDILCWTDFGIHMTIYNGDTVFHPFLELDKRKFNLDKINICIMNKINEFVSNPINMLVHSPEIFSGGFFLGNIDCMNKLHSLYHQCLDELYEHNIADDDQHIYLRCYLYDPDKFEIFKSNNYFGHNPALILWPRGLEYFQKEYNHMTEYLQKYLPTNISGIFVQIGYQTKFNDYMSKYLLSRYQYITLNVISRNENINYNGVHLIEKYGERIKFNDNKSNDLIDFVYIDENHDYQSIKKYLELWFEKLRVGGLICITKACDTKSVHSRRDNENNVHIQWNKNDNGKYGVLHACKDFCREMKIAYYVFREIVFIFKPLYIDKIF